METWREIVSEFPNEHVVIANPQCPSDNPTQLESGEVVDHDVDLDNLLHRCDLSVYDSYAVLYTGDLGEALGERGMIRVIEHD